MIHLCPLETAIFLCFSLKPGFACAQKRISFQGIHWVQDYCLPDHTLLRVMTSVSKAKSFPCENKTTVGCGSQRFQSTQGHPCEVKLHWKRDAKISPTCLYTLSNSLLVSDANSSIFSQHSLMNRRGNLRY